MSLSPTKRRAEQFADLLERDARTDDPGLAPLVALGTALRSAAVTDDGPAPEFRSALRQPLVAVATVQGVGETASVTTRVRESAGAWRVQGRVALVAGGAAAVAAVAGVSIGASRSLPGDAFYGLKQASESVQLATARGDEAKGKKHLDFARARLSEVKSLAGRGEALPALVPGRQGWAPPCARRAPPAALRRAGHIDRQRHHYRHAACDGRADAFRRRGSLRRLPAFGLDRAADDAARVHAEAVRRAAGAPPVATGRRAAAGQALAGAAPHRRHGDGRTGTAYDRYRRLRRHADALTVTVAIPSRRFERTTQAHAQHRDHAGQRRRRHEADARRDRLGAGRPDDPAGSDGRPVADRPPDGPAVDASAPAGSGRTAPRLSTASRLIGPPPTSASAHADAVHRCGLGGF